MDLFQYVFSLETLIPKLKVAHGSQELRAPHSPKPAPPADTAGRHPKTREGTARQPAPAPSSAGHGLGARTI